MGNRLVQKISYKGKFLAASYNHWSADDWDVFENKLDDAIVEFDLFKDENATPLNAVKVLKTAVDRAIYDTDEIDEIDSRNGCGLENWDVGYSFDGKEYVSNDQKVFIALHPEIKLATDRFLGLITVDKKIADYWESFSEALNNFDFT